MKALFVNFENDNNKKEKETEKVHNKNFQIDAIMKFLHGQIYQDRIQKPFISFWINPCSSAHECRDRKVVFAAKID